jgi:hypothetical protein
LNSPNYLVSDEIACSSVARAAGDAATWSVAGGKLADSYTRPLLHIRVTQPTAAIDEPLLGVPIAISATDSPFNPAQPTKSGRFVSCRNAAAATEQLSVGGATALTGTTYGPFSGIINMPIVGIIFKYRSKCLSVMCVGDSITDGAGLNSGNTAGQGRPWSLIAQQEASTMEHPIEYGKLALAGVSSTVYLGYLSGLVAAGVKPNVVMFPSITPNDGDTNETNLQAFVDLCAANQMRSVIWTGLPIGLLSPQTASWTDADESRRVALNEAIRARTKYPSADWAEFERGATYLTDDATPKASIPALYADAIDLHPNYAGDGLMRAMAKNKYLEIGVTYF